MLAEDLRFSVALDALGAGVPVGDVAGRVNHVDGVIGHALDQQPEPALRLELGLLRREILELHDIILEFVLAGDQRDPEFLLVGVGQLLLQLCALQIDLRIDARGAKLPCHLEIPAEIPLIHRDDDRLGRRPGNGVKQPRLLELREKARQSYRDPDAGELRVRKVARQVVVSPA